MSRSTRFNDPKYVEAWEAHEAYPAIHDYIFTAAAQYLRNEPTLDLCSSTGLLGRRVLNRLDIPCVAVDSDKAAIDRGSTAGVYGDDLPVLHLAITHDTFPVLFDFIRTHGVTQVLARRCVYELNEVIDPTEFSAVLATAGVKRIILEGHHVVPGGHPLLSADAQAAALPDYKVKHAYRQVRVLDRIG